MNEVQIKKMVNITTAADIAFKIDFGITYLMKYLL